MVPCAVCVCESLLGVSMDDLLRIAITYLRRVTVTAAIGTLITGLYYVAQIVVYRIVGYAFTSRLLCILQWILWASTPPRSFLGFASARAYPYIFFYPSASEGLYYRIGSVDPGPDCVYLQRFCGFFTTPSFSLTYFHFVPLQIKHNPG